MTQSIIILTPFADMSELAENFASRVDESHLMLPYSEAVAEEEWVHFVVQLADESPVITGQGRCTGSNDNGDEYPAEYRFDVVLDSLQFEGMSEVMFERILVARESQASGDPGTGEIDLDQMNAQAAEVSQPAYEEASGVEAYADPGAVDFAEPSEAAYPAASALDAVPDAFEDEEEDVPTQFGTALRVDAAPAPATVTQALDEEPASAEEWHDEDGDFDQPTQMGRVDEQTLQAATRSAPPPRAPAAPVVAAAPIAAAPIAAPAAGPRPSPREKQRAVGSLPLMHTFEEGVLTRPSLDASWVPTVTPRPEAAQSSGLFDYGGPIPRPASPPRPDLTDDLRVVPAPSPSAPWSRAPEEIAAEI